MLRAIAADDLYVQELCTFGLCNVLPLSPSQLNRITGIGHDTYSQAQIIRGYAICESVPFTLNLKITQVSQGLFDGIDPQVNGPEISCQQLRQRRLSRRR